MRANVEMAAAITLADRAWAQLEQPRIARRFQQVFERFALVLSPVTPVSPFPWTRLYAEQVDGKAMRNYCEWLALTYVVTLATNPALCRPRPALDLLSRANPELRSIVTHPPRVRRVLRLTARG